MANTNNKLIIKQFDRKLQILQPLRVLDQPREGWISLIRKSLHMSLRQMGERLSMTAQGVKKIETNEAEGVITLKALREAGNALGMQLVYGFIPQEESLEKMVEKQAEKLARQIVMRTSTTMKLEDQENTRERINEAIVEMTEELKREMPRTLWD